MSAHIDGFVAEGFAPVRDVFVQNFSERQERGAACAVYHQGKKVVDLWGGYRHAKRGQLWQEDTVIPVFSVTKGIASVALAIAHSRGWLDYEQTLSHYWPAFGQRGKGGITVRQMLAHQAGVPAIDIPLDDRLSDLDAMAEALAAQKLFWNPGEYHGYHSATLGWYEGELLRRVDPLGRSLGQFLQDEVMDVLGEEFYIGLPLDFPDERLAHVEAPNLLTMPLHTSKLPWRFIRAFMNPWSISYKTIKNPRILQQPGNINRRDLLSWQVPAVNGVGQVRSIARIYGELAVGGAALGIAEDTFAALSAPAKTPPGGAMDIVLRMETAYALGYMKTNPAFPFCESPHAFGTPGAGGSLGFADPEHQMGFAYAPTRMDFYIFGDPREKALRDTVYACLEQL